MYVLLVAYRSLYIRDSGANLDSADTNRDSMRKSGFHPPPENLIFLILTYLKTFSETVKLNMY